MLLPASYNNPQLPGQVAFRFHGICFAAIRTKLAQPPGARNISPISNTP
jgi:hypothetical protein